jgi:hypothetical protein
MKLKFDPALRISEKAFGAVVSDDVLSVPERLADELGITPDHANTAIDLLAYMECSSLSDLGWTKEQEKQALTELVSMLRGHVSDQLLDEVLNMSPRPGRFPWGVRPTGGK